MTTLGQLVVEGGIQTGPFGSQLHSSDYSAEGVGVVMPQDIGDNTVDPGSMARINEGVAKGLTRHRLVPGDIVFSRRGDVTRRALIRPSDGELICGTGCLRVRLDNALADPAYVSFGLARPDVREWLVRHAVGATMPNLNTSILSELPFAVPELWEQRLIGEILGALDDKIATNRRVIDASRELVAALYRSVPKRLGPETFGDIVDIGGGATPSTKRPELWDDGILWATPTDITGLEGVWLGMTHRTISEAGLAAISSALYDSGSILMTSRATIGACAINSEPTAVNQGFIVLRPRRDRHRVWLYQQVLERADEFRAWANGATFLELPKKIFRNLPVALPLEGSFSEFADVADPIMDRVRYSQAENLRLAATRDELLPLLMSGKITVKDAEKTVEEVV